MEIGFGFIIFLFRIYFSALHLGLLGFYVAKVFNSGMCYARNHRTIDFIQLIFPFGYNPMMKSVKMLIKPKINKKKRQIKNDDRIILWLSVSLRRSLAVLPLFLSVLLEMPK